MLKAAIIGGFFLFVKITRKTTNGILK